MAITKERTEALMAAAKIGTVVDLAERAQLSRGQIYEIWKSDEGVSLNTLRRLSRALRITVAELIGDTPPTRPELRPEQQTLINMLDSLKARDRATLYVLMLGFTRAIKGDSNTSEEEERGESERIKTLVNRLDEGETSSGSEARRLSAIVNRLDAATKQQFFQEVADLGLLEAISIGPKRRRTS